MASCICSQFSPILRSDFEGPARGALILGREISPAMLENIKDKFGYDISIAFKNTLISTPEKQTLSGKFIGRLLKSDEKIIELDDNYLAGAKDTCRYFRYKQCQALCFSVKRCLSCYTEITKKQRTIYIVI